MRQTPVGDVRHPHVRLHVRVRVRALHRDAKLAPGFEIGSRVEPAQVRVSRRADASVGALRSSQAELEQHGVVSGDQPVPRRVGRDQRRVIHQVQQRRLDELHDHERALHAEQRYAREHHRAFQLRVDAQGSAV